MRLTLCRTLGVTFGMLFGMLFCMLFGMTACGSLTNSGDLPAGTSDPSVYDNASGAIGLRNAAVYQVDLVIPDYVVNSGLLTDELQDKQTGVGQGTFLQSNGVRDPLDERILTEGNDQFTGTSYAGLQSVRAKVNLALAALTQYDTAAADTVLQHLYRGELYAYAGYVEILLADLYCSGVPLSTLDFHGDFTYQPSSTTTGVYRDALRKLDSALALGAAGDSIVNLARVLRGRAYLALGQYDSAASAVVAVPNSFLYRMTVNFPSLLGLNGGVADREGTNGLPYVTDADPRIVTSVVCSAGSDDCRNVDLRFPSMYPLATYTTFVVASGIEAQLVRAEAELQPAAAPAGPWLTTLNTLRASIGLSDTTDPGTAAGRISLLMRERAYWLFLTGHRQGDLRRQLRQYAQFWPDESDVYPTGEYTAPGTGLYGTDVTVPIPAAETANPAFHGCLDRKP